MEEDSIIWSHTFQNANTDYETMVRFIEGRGDAVFVGGYGPSLWDDIHSFVKAMGASCCSKTAPQPGMALKLARSPQGFTT